MLHFLLIILALLAIWKLLGQQSVSGATLLTGLRRIALVLAIASAILGGLIGYYATRNCHTDTTGGQWVTTCSPSDPGAIVLGVAVGFGVVWIVASVVIWIVRGFMTPTP